MPPAPILSEFWPKKPTGRKVANWRKMLNAIIFRMRSGCQWDQLPERYGPKSTVHDWFQRWAEAGIMERIWAVLAAECDELGGCSGSGNRPMRCWARPGSGGKKTGKNPTDRGKKGTKKNLLTDGDGGPLGVVTAGANVVEQKLLEATIDAIVIERPEPTEGGAAAPVPGQGVRQSDGRESSDRCLVHPAHPPDRRREEVVRQLEGREATAMGGGADVRRGCRNAAGFW